MSFKIYLMTRKRGPNPQGDFIAHAQGDPVILGAACWLDLKAYLLRRGASEGAVDSARMVWRAYRAAQARRASRPAAHRLAA